MPDVLSDDELLHRYTDTLKRLLLCPDLNLDELEEETCEAVAQAQRVLEVLEQNREDYA